MPAEDKNFRRFWNLMMLRDAHVWFYIPTAIVSLKMETYFVCFLGIVHLTFLLILILIGFCNTHWRRFRPYISDSAFVIYGSAVLKS